MSGRNSRSIQLSRTFAVFLTLALIVLMRTMPVSAHGEATMVVTPVVVAPGDVINVQGEGGEAGEEYTISLEGVKSQSALGVVTAGDDEDFHTEFTVLADTEPGPYLVTAISEEGETLSAELTVEGAASPERSAVPTEPSTALMQLDRSKTLREWVVIGFGLLLSAGVGLALVWTRGSSAA